MENFKNVQKLGICTSEILQSLTSFGKMRMTNKLPLKFILGALGAGTATVACGTYAYHKMREFPELQKQEDLLPLPQLMPVSSLIDQNHITGQKFVLKCELECFPSEKRSANDPMSDNPSTTETENKTNQHPQKKEEAKPGRFPAASVKLVSDESSVPLETSEFLPQLKIVNALSQDQGCLDLALVGNENCQLPIMNLQQCEFATVSAKQDEIQHKLKPNNSAQSSLDDNRDSKECECAKTAKKIGIKQDEPATETQPGKINWLRRLLTPEDISNENEDPENCESETELKSGHQYDVYFEILKYLVI